MIDNKTRLFERR